MRCGAEMLVAGLCRASRAYGPLTLDQGGCCGTDVTLLREGGRKFAQNAKVTLGGSVVFGI
jgi:hypothetical protein